MSDEIRILYVEDNSGDVELLDLCFSRYSHSSVIKLDVAETVEEAKVLFNLEQHSLTLIDWNLPDGTGTDVAQFIREIDKNCPIFMLSGALTDEHRLKVEKYTPTACLEKNYNKEFIDYIYSFL